MSRPTKADEAAATLLVVAAWFLAGGFGWFFLCRDVFRVAFQGRPS